MKLIPFTDESLFGPSVVLFSNSLILEKIPSKTYESEKLGTTWKTKCVQTLHTLYIVENVAQIHSKRLFKAAKINLFSAFHYLTHSIVLERKYKIKMI